MANAYIENNEYEEYDDESYEFHYDDLQNEEYLVPEDTSLVSDADETLMPSTSEVNDILIENDLREWALTYKITHIALSNLLVILRKNGMKKLRKDARTVLRTPREISVRKMGDGEYWHNGLAKSIRDAFGTIEEDKSIFLTFNMDGLQPKESSKYQVWPILAEIHDMPKMRPLVVGIYAGCSKPPSPNEYLTEFCNELNDVVENGVFLNGHTISVKIRCFVCDTPARAFIKGKHILEKLSGLTN